MNKQYNAGINNSIINEKAMNLIEKNYNILFQKLIKTDLDRDIFNDTVLSISYKYDENKVFIEQFRHEFNKNKYGKVRELAEEKKRIVQFVEGYESFLTDEEEECTYTNNNNNIIEELKQYADNQQTDIKQ